LDKLKNGSYSIALYDRKTAFLYYLKNNKTDIHFYTNEKENKLFITTSFYNDKYLKLAFKEDFNKVFISDFSIYRIKVKNRIEIKKVSSLKQKKSYNNWGIIFEKDTNKDTNKGFYDYSSKCSYV
jgi:hypothetical protein